jgi:hypothetical protein
MKTMKKEAEPTEDSTKKAEQPKRMSSRQSSGAASDSSSPRPKSVQGKKGKVSESAQPNEKEVPTIPVEEQRKGRSGLIPGTHSMMSEPIPTAKLAESLDQLYEEDETWSKGIFTGQNLPPWKTITHDMWYIQEKKTGGLHQITASPMRHWGWTEKWHTSCPSPGQTH